MWASDAKFNILVQFSAQLGVERNTVKMSGMYIRHLFGNIGTSDLVKRETQRQKETLRPAIICDIVSPALCSVISRRVIRVLSVMPELSQMKERSVRYVVLWYMSADEWSVETTRADGEAYCWSWKPSELSRHTGTDAYELCELGTKFELTEMS